jgi:hypothetical protein
MDDAERERTRRWGTVADSGKRRAAVAANS